MQNQSKFILVIAAVAVIVIVLSTQQGTNFLSQNIFTQSTSTVTIKTTPASCVVTLSGGLLLSPVSKDSGTTGAVFTLGAGIYTASVAKSGYNTKSVAVIVGSIPVLIPVTLDSGGGGTTTYTITVTTTPTGCTITIPGHTGTTTSTGATFSGLAAGTYSITVSKSGYNSQTVSATISSSSITKPVTLTAIGGGSGGGGGGGGGGTPTPTNSAPLTPSISYPNSHQGYTGENQKFELNAWDPDLSNTLSYRVDWGDGDGWSSYIAFTNLRNEGVYTKTAKQIEHTYISDFNGVIKAQSKDGGGLESPVLSYAWSSIPHPYYNLQVSVLDSVSGSGIYGALVTAGEGTQYSESDGSAYFSQLDADTYDITVSKVGYQSATDSATVPGVSGDVNKEIRLTLLTYNAEITVVNASNRPIADATVTFGVAQQTTNPQGVATFTSLMTGTYNIFVSKTGYADKTDSATISDTGVTKTITLTSTTPPPADTWVLTVITTPTGCTISIPGKSGTTTSTGATFTLPIGTYTITVSKTGYQTQTRSTTISAAKTEPFTLTQEIILPGTYTLTVTVSDTATDTPLSGATVSCSSVTGTQTTDSNGVATFSNLYGTYQITASKTGFLSSTTGVSVTGDTPSSIKLTVITPAPPPLHALTVITNPGASVTIVELSRTVASGSTGVVLFKDVPADSYTIVIQKDGYKVKSESIVMTDINKQVTYSLEKEVKGIPGFEGITLVIAIGIAFILLKKRKK